MLSQVLVWSDRADLVVHECGVPLNSVPNYDGLVVAACDEHVTVSGYACD